MKQHHAEAEDELTLETIDGVTRAALYVRAGGRCELCNFKHDLCGPWHAHHCQPKSRDNKADRHQLWNLALLCPACHLGKVHRSPYLLKRFADQALTRREKREQGKDPVLLVKKGLRTQQYKQRTNKVGVAKGALCRICKKPFGAKDRRDGDAHLTCLQAQVSGMLREMPGDEEATP
jgi:hypothetical protein